MTDLYVGASAAFEPSGDLVEMRELLAYCKGLRMDWPRARREVLDIFPQFRPVADGNGDEEPWLDFLWRHMRCAYLDEPAEKPCVECDELTAEPLCWRCKPRGRGIRAEEVLAS